MELEQMSEEELMSTIEMVCLSKVEEMHLIGYEYVTSDDIWNCVSSKYKKEGVPSLHKLVNDILSLKATALMNYMTISAYKGSSFD
ncbi:post-transcriptional regulator [Paenibacillus lautus]|uniref:post-transcriptional regulator n=1 Tax=Paenibacillus lautus TaxID=1401 RepID=UPI000FD916A2|nr:post-transcriptional regulator [Paenibacillus lautus]